MHPYPIQCKSSYYESEAMKLIMNKGGVNTSLKYSLEMSKIMQDISKDRFQYWYSLFFCIVKFKMSL